MWTLVYFLLMVVIFLMAIKSPAYSLVGFLCMFGLEQWGVLYFPAIRAYSQFTNILFLAIVIISVLRNMPYINFKAELDSSKVRTWSILLFLYAFISVLWSPEDANALAFWGDSWPYIVAAIILAPLTIRNLNDCENVQKWVILYGGVLITLFAYVPKWGNRALMINGVESLGLPLALSMLSGFILIAAVLTVKKNIVSIAIVFIVSISTLFVMIKTGSRGQFLFALLSIVIVAPFTWKAAASKNFFSIIVVVTLLGYAASYIFSTTGLLTERWTYNELSEDAFGRLDMAFRLLGFWFSDPFNILFGLGNSASFSIEYIGIYPHIVILEVLGEEGLIGMSFFALIVYFVLKGFFQEVNNKRLDARTKKILSVNFAWWIFCLFLSFKQGSLITSPELFLFAAISERLIMLIKKREVSNGKRVAR